MGLWIIYGTLIWLNSSIVFIPSSAELKLQSGTTVWFREAPSVCRLSSGQYKVKYHLLTDINVMHNIKYVKNAYDFDLEPYRKNRSIKTQNHQQFGHRDGVPDCNLTQICPD